MTRFSVNLNKFALIRNSRGGEKPSVQKIAERCIARGVHGITVHPRSDQRHVRDTDVLNLARLIAASADVELNVEGYPDSRLIELVVRTKPTQCTLVPDAPNQLTSDHGWDVLSERVLLDDVIAVLKHAGVRVSLFVDPSLAQIEAASLVGADRIELYTGPYAREFAGPRRTESLASYAQAAANAQSLGLGVNAGHDLDLENLGPFLRAVPDVLEVSIGHAVVCDALDLGLEATLDRYLAIVTG